MDFGKKKYVLLDLDGTLYAGSHLFPYTLDFLEAVRAGGRKPVFLTNNSSRSRADYLDKLAGLKIAKNLEEIYTSGTATIEYLQAAGLKDIFLMATPSATEEWVEAGFTIRNGTEKPKDEGKSLPGHSKVQESCGNSKKVADECARAHENETGLTVGQQSFSGALPDALPQEVVLNPGLPQAVVLAFDKTFTYEKFCAAHELITAGVPFYATHPDNHVPLEDGKYHPDIGTFIKAFEVSAGKWPFIIGKPEKHIYEQLRAHLNCKPDEMVMVGDRLNTDILGANNFGMDSILVLSGETTREMLAGAPKEQQPTMVTDNVGELMRYLQV